MKDVYILGIESSCDETSMSIIKNGREEELENLVRRVLELPGIESVERYDMEDIPS